MALGLSLDHIILPKDLTDGFYSTWHNYYGELFPSPVKPKYRPMSKIFSCEGESITQSSPNLFFEKAKTPVINRPPLEVSLSIGGQNTRRVGDNIDEFIRNNRKEMFRSNSLNDLINEFEDKDNIFSKVLDGSAEKQKSTPDGAENATPTTIPTPTRPVVKLRPKSDLTQNASRKSHRFSWGGSRQTIKFLTSLQGKKKTYEFCTAQDRCNSNFDFNANDVIKK